MFKKSLLLMLLMAFMAPWAAGQTRATVYEKVTESQSDWSGTYVLASSVNSQTYGATTTIANSGLQEVTMTVSGNNIVNTNGAVEWIFEESSTGSGKYYIKYQTNESSYLYLQGSSTTALALSSSPSSSSTGGFLWSISYSSSHVVLQTKKSSSTIYIRFNTTYHFMASSSSSYANPVDLYKKTESTTPSITIDPTTATVLPGGKMSLTAETSNVDGSETIAWTVEPTIGVVTISPNTGSEIEVTGVAAGSATITATMTYQGNAYPSTNACNVTVVSEILMQNGTISIPTTGSFNFYDSGGSTGDYSSYENYTLTLYPTASNNMVKAAFTEFETEGVDWDYLSIYDGTSTSATLIGTYGGTTSPETVTASNSEGALTFSFHSDSGGNKLGWAATVSCEAPSALALGEVTDVTYNSAVVNWTGGISPYTVKYKKHSDSDWTTASSTVTTKSFQLNDLDPETVYDVEVTDANTSVSQDEYFTTGVAPLVITDATSVTYNSATVNWTGGKANFTVQYKKHSDSGWTTASSSVSTRYYTITPLTDNTTYDVKIVDALETAIDRENYFTTEVQYPAPTGLTASNVLAHTAVLNWTVNGTETSWDICYSTTSGDHSTFVTVSPASSENTVTYTLGNNDGVNLASETTYYVSVRSHCGNGEGEHSAWSNEVNFTTDIACHVPTGLTATGITTSSATLAWESSASSFNLQYKAAGDADFTTVPNISGNSYDLTVTPATSYTYKVQAICGGGDGSSEYSEEFAFTTPICDEEDQCVIYYSLQDQWNDGWNDAHITIVDHATSIVVADLTLKSTTYDPNPKTGTVNVCPGRTYDFVWYKGSYDGECSFSFTDINEEVIINVEQGGASSYTDGQIIKSEYTATCVSTICQKPENLAVSGEPTINSVTLTWDAISGVAGYEVYISKNATAPTDEVSGEFTNTNSYTTNTLDDNTQYHAWVRTKCADEFYSHWISTSVDFKTQLDCSAKDLSVSSYFEGFEGGDLGCWSVSNANTESIVTSSANHTDNYGFQFKYNTNPPQYLISPEFSGTDAGINVDFYYRNHNTGNVETFQVGYSTTTNEVSAFTWYEDVITASTAQWAHYENSFPEGTKFIAIKYLSNDKYYLYLDDFTFSAVPTTCDDPTELTASVNGLKATIGWTSDASSFNVKYKPQSESTYTDTISSTNSIELTGLEPNTLYDFEVQAVCAPGLTSEWESTTFETGADPCIKILPYAYGFEDAEDFECWTMVDCTSGTGRTASSGISNTYGFKFNYNSNPPQYLISPELTTMKDVVVVKFYYENVNSMFSETFEVGYSTTNVITDFNWGDEITASDGSWTLYEATVPASTKYIAIKYTSNDQAGLAIDDFSINVYDKLFTKITDNGLWTESANWNAGEPVGIQSAFINGAATIPGGCTATADNITIGTNGSITIAAGGQLICNNAPTVTVQKSIDAAENWNTESKGWYFIASPITSEYTPAGDMIANEYDLYRLDPATTMWENYKENTDPEAPLNAAAGFKLVNERGYLYANSADVTLSFTGAIVPFAATKEVTVETGWNLIGNPFTYEVYANQDYYKMNGDGTAIASVTKGTETIAPCTGIVVEAAGAGNVIFSKTSPSMSNGNQGNLQMTLAQQVTNTRGNSSKTLDNAIVSFNEGSELHKFYFMQQNANLYIPQGNEEYAIVNAEAQGTMPVNFRANENGQYTLTVNAENVEMNYLHLIDNMTGADIDLLQTPSYSFNATVTDYESRFKLVFCTGVNDNSDSFAFYSNGNWIVSNEGEATLQVIDINGRILSSETVNGSVSKSINAAPGVYMIRLINGENVKVQKVVIE